MTECWPGARCEGYHLYCFAKRQDAQAFIDRFGGEHFDPTRIAAEASSGIIGCGRAWETADNGTPKSWATWSKRLVTNRVSIKTCLGCSACPQRCGSPGAGDVESLLRARLPMAEWRIDLEPAIDAEFRAHPAADWYRAGRPPLPALKSDAIALSLAFLRAMHVQF